MEDDASSRQIPQWVEDAIPILAKYDSLEAAAAEVGKSADSIRHGFRRWGQNAVAFLRQGVVQQSSGVAAESSGARRVQLAHGSKHVHASVNIGENVNVAKREVDVPVNDPLSQRLRKAAEQRAKDERDALLDQLQELRQRQSFLDAIGKEHEPPRILRREKWNTHEVTPIVLASDWHAEEEVDPVSVAGRNKYNLEIADKRIERFWQGAIWLTEHQRADGTFKIRDMVLCLLGDFMSGRIHDENVETGQLSPVETVRWLLPRLRNGIASLLDRLKLEKLVVVCSHGNHGRTTDRSRVSTGAVNNYEWLLYSCLADSFAGDPRVVFEITKSEHQYVQVYDFWIHAHHGHEVRYNGGVGGICIPLLKAVDKWDRVKPCDYHVVAHWHQQRDFRRAIVNGSVIGYNAYAMSIGAEYEEPVQTFFMIDKSRGKATGAEPIWTTEPQARAA